MKQSKNIHPMLFSTPMVQAILAGNKTMTRRVVKTKYSNTDIEWRETKYGKILVEKKNDVPPPEIIKEENGIITTRRHLVPYREITCPYGKPGDIIWVRETWQKVSTYPEPDCFGKYLYKSMGDTPETWKPSIFMPKDACRLFLMITDVKVERLQDISKKDAIAEGIEPDPIGDGLFKNYLSSYHANMKEKKRFSNYSYISASESFKSLWMSINGEENWNSNPWVWCISFEKTDKPENF